MSPPLVVGITGGIGAGKSVVARIFRILGINIYNADERAKLLIITAPEIRRSIIDLLGTGSYDGEEYNTQFVAERVFGNPSLLSALNNIVHPAVNDDFAEWLRGFENEHYVIKEAALLFETGSFKQLDKTIIVTAPKEIKISRVLERDPARTEGQVKDIMQRQWNDKKKRELADFEIMNGPQDLLIPQVLDLHRRFSSH